MKYTKQQRAQIADAFRAAKKILWKGTGSKLPSSMHRYICLAINQSGGFFAGPMARKIVMQRLGKHSYLGQWLIEQGVPRVLQTDRRMQQHRHAWLDSLIKEFSS